MCLVPALLWWYGRISFTRFIELVAFFPREVPIVSVSPFLVGWTGRLYVFSVDTDFLFFRRDRCKSLAWCLLHMFQYLVLTLVLGWYRWVHRRPKLNITGCINFSEHVLRYWVWEPVLSAPPDYELRSPIIEHNKAVQSTFLRTEIT